MNIEILRQRALEWLEKRGFKGNTTIMADFASEEMALIVDCLALANKEIALDREKIANLENQLAHWKDVGKKFMERSKELEKQLTGAAR